VILDPGVSDWRDGVWWTFLRLTDPGYLGDDDGVVRRVVSTIVTVLGYLLFLGLLIAILTQWLDETIRKLESGTTPVRLEDHVIILGWTHRTPASCYAAATRERALTRYGGKPSREGVAITPISE